MRSFVRNIWYRLTKCEGWYFCTFPNGVQRALYWNGYRFDDRLGYLYGTPSKVVDCYA